MEGDANQMSQATLCRSGCGFYGNPAQDGLCSKCFKDALKRKQSTPASAQSSAISASSRGGSSPPSSGPSPIMTTTECSSPPPPLPPHPSSPPLPLLLSSNSDMLASMTTASPTVPIVVCSNAGSSSPSSSSPNGESEKCNLDGGLEGAHAAIESMDTDASQDANDFAQRDKKKKNRCQTCRKKVGLTGFECRCGGLFCSLHRYSDKHDCSFDYKGLGAQEIRKNNPIVVGEKIQKI